jgi:hypothetical protein
MKHLVSDLSERARSVAAAIGNRPTAVALLTMSVELARQWGCDREQWLRLCGSIWDTVHEIPLPTAKGGDA